LIQYYNEVYPFLKNHIHDRPQSLHIKLHGANAPGLYIKDMEGRQPDCALIYTDERRHKAEGKRNVIDYLVCNNKATLLWMINIGCVDVNPWNSRMTSPEYPDYIVIDLDPSEEVRTDQGLKRLRDTASATVEYCRTRQLKIFMKSSGKSGIHILIPCRGFTYSIARNFAEHICEDIQQLVPEISTTEISVSQRRGKVFIDPSQNDYADTIAAPYSVRPYIIPSVSTPIEAKEIRKVDPHDFTINTIFDRLHRKGDLFEKINDAKLIEGNNRVLKKL
jgi:bifunctional non-homologous end joining protein LigD